MNKIKIGFIALTDCASVVLAHELGFFEKHGLRVELTREASWAIIRDKVLAGELQAAHCLFSMPFSVYTGIGGPAGSEMHVAMVLSNNGQAITLGKALSASVGFQQLGQVKTAVEQLQQQKGGVTFAMTFPGGTHDIWLRYWLAAAGVNPQTVKIITIPPPQMVANLQADKMDGYSVGEPWNGVAVAQGLGVTHLASQDIWRHHPEKALVCHKTFSETRRDELKAVMKAVLEASMWLDDLTHRQEAAAIIGKPAYVNAPPVIIEARLRGEYDVDGKRKHAYADDYLLFHRGGQTNFPRKAHGIWFLAQYVRFGYLPQAPAYQSIADKLILQDVYLEVAQSMNIALPDDDMKPFTIDLDKSVFDPNQPATMLTTTA